ncbi:MAG: hypothetical protein H7210_09035 [Pyrinomonadaceae bacterium]|nr:hypothetical protein [Phycisphaerales bacterium]
MALIRNSVAQDLTRDAIVMDLADVRVQADLIVEHAMKRAQALVTESEAERLRQITGAAQLGQKDGYAKGLAEGRQTGLTQGREEGLREARPKLDEVQTAWAAALTDFQARREDLLLDARTTILDLAICIASKIVKRTIELDASVVVDQIATVLELVVMPSKLVVSINPEDRALVESSLPTLMASCRTARHVELAEDPSVSRGSCRAVAQREITAGSTTSGGEGTLEINATIEHQLKRITDALLPKQAG